MIYDNHYVDGFREFTRRAFATTEPVDVIIDGEDMRAYIRGIEGTQLKADPPFFGYVDRAVGGKLQAREMCETPQQYTEQIAEACKWAEDSPADRSVRADRLTYVGHYADLAPERAKQRY